MSRKPDHAAASEPDPGATVILRAGQPVRDRNTAEFLVDEVEAAQTAPVESATEPPRPAEPTVVLRAGEPERDAAAASEETNPGLQAEPTVMLRAGEPAPDAAAPREEILPDLRLEPTVALRAGEPGRDAEVASEETDPGLKVEPTVMLRAGEPAPDAAAAREATHPGLMLEPTVALRAGEPAPLPPKPEPSPAGAEDALATLMLRPGDSPWERKPPPRSTDEMEQGLGTVRMSTQPDPAATVPAVSVPELLQRPAESDPLATVAIPAGHHAHDAGPAPARSSRPWLPWAIAGAVLVLGGGGAAAWVLLRGGDEARQEEGSAGAGNATGTAGTASLSKEEAAGAKEPSLDAIEPVLRPYMEKARQGDPSAMRMVGLMYYYGQGVKRNPEEGKRWTRKAAEAGSHTAELDLKQMEGGR